ELFLVTENEDDIDKILVTNFPKLAISRTDCKNLTVISSNISFAEEGPTEQCQGKVFVLRNSITDRIPKDVAKFFAYKSTIQVLDNGHLQFVSMHNSTVRSVSDLRLFSADMTFVDSVIASLGKVSIDKNSSVRFIKSHLTFRQGGYFDVHGELTLESTNVDIKAIHLNPTAKFQMLSPKASWFQNVTMMTQEGSEENAFDTREKNDIDFSLFRDPETSSGIKVNTSLALNFVLLVHVFLLK
ncbi:hypothetical protein SK128_018513, partial [Halocaridina rubra]